jgi:RNA polymerase sigma factor (sigma-70 family)
VSRYTHAILETVDRIFHRGTVAGLNEATLLERFVAQRDEAAFAAIVARHGPMVLGVCRRHLRDECDIEDAFQATFLVLVRRAGAIRDGDLVGHWLYGVAHRVAVRARAHAARRHAHEPNLGAKACAVAAPPEDEGARQELRAVIDEEIARLPDALRAPLVLCYLEGHTHEEAAARLRWPVGTVRSRMARARDRLRQRLVRRGIAGDDLELTTALAAAPLAPALADVTVQASLALIAGKPLAAVTSATAAALAEGVTNAMMLTKLKVLAGATLACVITLGGWKSYAFQFGGAGAAPPPRKAVAKADDRQAALLRAVDRIQADLQESARRNAELQKQVETLRAELQALRSNTPPAAGEETPRPEEPRESKTPETLGKSQTAAAPSYFWLGDDAIMVTAPEGDRITVYYPATKTASSYRLSEDRTNPHEVTPIATPDVVALMVSGPKITQLGVFLPREKQWYPLKLREPVDEASPVISPGTCVYNLGRRIYAFTSTAKRWDVVEFPEGAEPRPYAQRPGSISYENDGHIYTFNARTGQWEDLDLRAILDAAEKPRGPKPVEK